MRRTITFAMAAALLLLSASCSHYSYETVKGDPLNTKIYTLDNGLQVYMTVNKETPRIQTYIAVKVGSKNDPLETTGLAHYFEHLMFKGTQQFGTSDYEAEKPLLDEIEALFETYRQTADQAQREAIYHKIDSISYQASLISIPNEYDKLMAMIGADGTNAWTSEDETVYTEDIPSNQIDNWARIQADRFKNVVLRGFHTELETIYEEKNMSLTQDGEKVWQAISNCLYPHHPYGIHDVLGFQEHLKNPSITNVRKYHDQYYVPNNIRICLSGDFNPDEMVATIEKYFGDWEPNPEIPVLSYEEEEPITSPIERNIYGLEAEYIAMAWRLPGAADLRNTAIADIAGAILYNGQAGLMDLDLMQQQKVIYSYAFNQTQPDYSAFISMAMPKEGQSLEEVRGLVLEEMGKLRNGDFDEELIKSTINVIKLGKMRELESNSARAEQYIRAFINGIDWADACREIERYSEITKEDIVAWAQEFLREDNYAVIYKRLGEDKTVQKISAPKITPIATNRDKQSAFLAEIQNTSVKPIEPVFVNFHKDMSQTDIAEGVHMLYKKNEINDIATVQIVFNTGSENDPELATASEYLEYLGTAEMSAEDIAVRMYALACNYTIRVGSDQTSISVSGLDENIAEALQVVESLIFGAEADEDILDAVKADLFKRRSDNKKVQRSCYQALSRYALYGGEFIDRIQLDNDEVAALTSEELLGKLAGLFDKQHEILYYGPSSQSQAKAMLAASHRIGTGLEPLVKTHPRLLLTEGNKVLLCQYDAKQIYYIQVSNRGESFDPSEKAAIMLYNEYFGGGMNSVVFQEMREARGLAYSAWASLNEPSYADDNYYYMAFIATQNDKTRTAVEAFDDIINNMPESEAAFSVAKESLISRMRTSRVTGMNVLLSFRKHRELGLDEPLEPRIFEALGDMTLEDVVATQRKWVKDRDYSYVILGDIADLDMDFLRSLGPVQELSKEEIFGF